MSTAFDWQRVPIFEVLPDNYLGVLDAGAKIKEFQPDEVILQLRTEPGIETMVIVLDGVVELRGRTGQWVVGLLHAGDFAFDSNLSIGRFPVECLAAVTKVRVAVLGWETVQALSKTVPPWRRQLKAEALRIDARLKDFQLM